MQDPRQEKSWWKIWLALVVGTLIGSSVVPALLERYARGGDWEAALEHAAGVVVTAWLPTVAVFSAAGLTALFIARRRGFFEKPGRAN
ncbi:hypothetical protein [Corynebacterium otitidis]